MYARRIVAQRCLYGIDKNPLAVEMAKLSLWLLTLAKDKPFTFLDHAVRCGDSLVGIRDLDQIKHFNLSPQRAERGLFTGPILELAQEAMALRRKIESSPSNTVEDVEVQKELLAQAEERTAQLRCIADLLLSVEFQPHRHAVNGYSISAAPKSREARHNAMAICASDHVTRGTIAEFQAVAKQAMSGQSTFHWPLEFPEVILDRSGFDALVCNPPFMGGQKITGTLSTAYRDYLVAHLAHGKRGSADLCAYFFLRAKELIRQGGRYGFLATNTIAQGDTRDVGIEQLTKDDWTIPRAVSSQKWPGTANLEVAVVWGHRGPWKGDYTLDGNPASGITPYLTMPGEVAGNPYRLAANAGKSFQGSIVLGMGFVLTPEEAQALINKNPRNRDVILPYLNGEDLNSRPDQSPSRWVINFFDWPLCREAKGNWACADERHRREYLRTGVVPDDYSDPVAADYPDCLTIVEDKVKPERDKYPPKNSWNIGVKTRWWQFGSYRLELRDAIALTRAHDVLVCSEVTKHLGFCMVPVNIIYSANLDVFPGCTISSFALLQSSLHEVWTRTYSSTLENRLKYSPGNAFETFPMPEPNQLQRLSSLGNTYHEHRYQIMLVHQEGLTKTYNRFHDPDETNSDIQKLRNLHIEMDRAVGAAYGWTDLTFGHGFHDTKQGIRFTISESARREVLARLLKLNHERYSEEVKQGLHEKGKAKKTGTAQGQKRSCTSRVSILLEATKDFQEVMHE